jgi:hypothetical protein
MPAQAGSDNGGYDINIGDDDDEFYLMSKRKGNASNRFKTNAIHERRNSNQVKNNNKVNYRNFEEETGEEANNYVIQPTTGEELFDYYSASMSPI